MYKQLEEEEYKDQWIKAERDLAINTLLLLDWFPGIQDDFISNENFIEPIDNPIKKVIKD
jgi:hypothetical protein